MKSDMTTEHNISDPDFEKGMHAFSVTEEDGGRRVDVFLSEKMEETSRSAVQKAASEKLLFVNNKNVKSNYKLKVGDKVEVRILESDIHEILPEDIPLEIVYEDDDVIVVNKPKGMVVHPAPGHYSGTLVNALLYHCGDKLSDLSGDEIRPGIVHRIDRDTSGLLVSAKTNEAHKSLSEQLKSHSVTRKYMAIVNNPFKEMEGTIDRPIARGSVERKRMVVDPEGRNAVTHYRVLENIGKYAFIECVLETGRTHQIRVHMKSIAHSLLGDSVYSGGKTPFNTDGQLLHAKILGFKHPRTGEYMEFDSELPESFEKALQLLRKNAKK